MVSSSRWLMVMGPLECAPAPLLRSAGLILGVSLMQQNVLSMADSNVFHWKRLNDG
jgi:hypothetical protein